MTWNFAKPPLVVASFNPQAAFATVIAWVVATPAASVVISDDRWAAEPALPARSYTDLYGNPCMRTVLPAGRSSVRYAETGAAPP